MRLPFTLDLGRAGFALFLSILLYVFSLSEANPEGRFELRDPVPVEVVNYPSGLVVTGRPSDVHIWVRAPLSAQGRLRADSFTAQVDASSAHAGDNEGLPVVVRWTDPDVRSAEADPPTVSVRLEEVQERVLPVRINLAGQVPTGYLLGTPRAEPSTVTVSGAASLVARAVEAVVDANVQGVTVRINGVYTPRIVDERGNDLRDLNLHITPPAVNVEVPITQQTQYKEVGVRPRTQGQPAAGYVVQPLEVNPPTVTLVGDAAALEAVNFVETQPIDINGISTTVVRNVALALPPRTLLLQEGQTVTVTIRVTTLVVQQTVRVPPTAINLSPNVALARVPEAVSVTISGPAPALSTLALNPGDFRVVLDLQGKGPGRWTVQPVVQRLPAGLTLVSMDPKQVEVELIQAPATPTPVPTSSG